MEDSVLPDLIVMDCCAIQVHAAKDVLASLNIDNPVMGVQKDNHHKASKIFFEEKLYDIERNSPIFLLLELNNRDCELFLL